MTIQQARKRLELQLRPLYEEREAANIADWVMERITGLRKIDRLLRKEEGLDGGAARLLEQFTQDLLTGRPVQYVLHEAWFCGMSFYVDESVLIPRPETEELVAWMATDLQGGEPALHGAGSVILDVGTGSGCIPISLKRMLPRYSLISCDVSPGAIALARRNAVQLGFAVEFIESDFLDRSQWPLLPPPQVLVSNPPYVPLRDKNTMTPGVLDHEPHLALFVKDDDALVFYRALAEFAYAKGAPTGRLYVEIHEELASGVVSLLEDAGMRDVEVRKDMQGKDRLIKATW